MLSRIFHRTIVIDSDEQFLFKEINNCLSNLDLKTRHWQRKKYYQLQFSKKYYILFDRYQYNQAKCPCKMVYYVTRLFAWLIPNRDLYQFKNWHHSCNTNNNNMPPYLLIEGRRYILKSELTKCNNGDKTKQQFISRGLYSMHVYLRNKYKL